MSNTYHFLEDNQFRVGAVLLDLAPCGGVEEQRAPNLEPMEGLVGGSAVDAASRRARPSQDNTERWEEAGRRGSRILSP